jgi:hypothetical protein
MLDDGSAGDILKNPLRISSPLRPSGRAAERSGYRAPGAVRGSRLILQEERAFKLAQAEAAPLQALGDFCAVRVYKPFSVLRSHP